MFENLKLTIEYWPIERFIEYARNPRKNDHVVDKAASWIKEFGFRVPILAKSDGTIVDGHLRLKAAKKLGMKEIPVSNADDMTEVQIKAFRLSVNKMSELADWDDDLLKIELEELDNLGYDIDNLGFDDIEIEGDKSNDGLTDPDQIPEVPQNVFGVKRGDVWLLGNHMLMCGDSTSESDVAKLMAGQKADMVFTDPPYGVRENTMRKSAGRSKLAKDHDFRPIIGDDSNCTAIKSFKLCEKLGFNGIWWGANYYANSLPELSSWLIWDKRDGVNSDDNADCELAWCWNKKPARIFRHLWKGCIRASEKSESKVHPTQKPIALAEWCFDNYGKPNTVIDLFLGSGSTLIACEKTNRICYGMEIDEHYCSVIIKRWQDFTGKTAIKEV
jgi:16S rRNA G966 N2-methylase RsmD